MTGPGDVGRDGATLGSGTVATVRCLSYASPAVDKAVERGIELLGGVRQFVAPGEMIVLKPNLLVGRDPDRAVTTHPSVFRAVARRLALAGGNLTYGDSPGFGRLPAVARRAGVAAAAEEVGVACAEFRRGRQVPFPEGRLIKRFTIAEGVVEADGLVSLPKLKTHGLTRITGAIKNQYGCIPGALKAELHARLPDVDRFSQMLVDLNRLLRPRLFVMDGIVAMEGNGPQNGRARPLGVLLFSSDPVALDATVCRIVGLDPALVLPVVYGARWGLGRASGIDHVGDPLGGFSVGDFDVNRRPGSTTGRPGRASRWARRLIVPRPVLLPERCTRCGTCVAVCPVTPKAIQFRSGHRSRPPRHHIDRCIRCYCCQEMCPEGAIELHVPPLGRLIDRGARSG